MTDTKLKAYRDRDNANMVIALNPQDASDVWDKEYGEEEMPTPSDVWEEMPMDRVVSIYRHEDMRKSHDVADSKTMEEWIAFKGCRCVLCVDTGEV